MAKEEILPLGGFVALAAHMILTILIAVLGLVGPSAQKYPCVTFTVGSNHPIALLMGLYMRSCAPTVLETHHWPRASGVLGRWLWLISIPTLRACLLTDPECVDCDCLLFAALYVRCGFCLPPRLLDTFIKVRTGVALPCSVSYSGIPSCYHPVVDGTGRSLPDGISVCLLSLSPAARSRFPSSSLQDDAHNPDHNRCADDRLWCDAMNRSGDYAMWRQPP